MRLPLRHPPPRVDPPYRRCAHLDALAEACVGLPLAGTARRLASRRSRGRHGAALQWHLGLSAHDAEARLDWEDRIEIKLVSVWARPDGRVGCDKLKVSEIAVDPWAKLANVLWVFADRLTRVVVATRQLHLAGETLTRLSASWEVDPHFGEPDLFVEAREQAGRSAPAYYLAARWFDREGLLPPPGPGIFPFDAKWSSQARGQGGGRDPLPAVATDGGGRQRCRRCGGPLSFDPEVVAAQGWAPAHHGLPHDGDCALCAHFVVAADRLPMPAALSPEEALSALEQLPGARWRLFDRVAEPSDHGH